MKAARINSIWTTTDLLRNHINRASRILVAVDGSENSERALRTTVDLAAKLDAQLVIVNIFEDYWNAAKVWKKHDSIVKELEEGTRCTPSEIP